MQLSRRSFLALTASGAIVFPGAVKGAAEITLLVPSDAGSRTGRLGRMIATGLAAQSGGPVEIVNFETPADAYLQLSRAPPDGRTLGIVTADLTVLHWRGLSGVRPSGLTPLPCWRPIPPVSICVRAIRSRRTAIWSPISRHGLASGAYPVRAVVRYGIWPRRAGSRRRGSACTPGSPLPAPGRRLQSSPQGIRISWCARCPKPGARRRDGR